MTPMIPKRKKEARESEEGWQREPMFDREPPGDFRIPERPGNVMTGGGKGGGKTAAMAADSSSAPSMASFGGAETPDEEVREKSVMGSVSSDGGGAFLAGKIMPINAGCFGEEVRCDMCAHYTGDDCTVVEGWTPEILGCVHLFKEVDHQDEEMGEEEAEGLEVGG